MVSVEATTILLFIINIIATNSQYITIPCGGSIEISADDKLNTSSNYYHYEYEIDWSNQDFTDFQSTYMTFTTIGIDNVSLNVNDNTKYPLESYTSYYFNISYFTVNIYNEAAGSTLESTVIVIFNTMSDFEDTSSYVAVTCENSSPSHFPLPIIENTITCQTITTSNETSIHYYNFSNTDTDHNITTTFLIESNDKHIDSSFNVEIFSYNQIINSWEQLSDNTQQAKLYDAGYFVVLTDMKPSVQYILAIGDYHTDPQSYTINATCSNVDKVSIPVKVGTNITCGEYRHVGQDTAVSTNTYYHTFRVENKQSFQIFRFESCSNCSNIFWIYGYNEKTNEWILSLNTEIQYTYTNYFDCTKDKDCAFDFIAYPHYLYYLGISTNSSNYYYFNVTCSKIKDNVQCPKYENNTLIKSANFTKRYFLHFYPFKWNYTIQFPPNASNVTTIDMIQTTDTRLDSLILSSCNSTTITEIGLLPYNHTSTLNEFLSKFKTQKSCLLSTTNVEVGEHLIGVVSYHSGFTGLGKYTLTMKCINSFPFEITDALSCNDFQLSQTTVEQKRNFFVFTSTEFQNKTVFDTCNSQFDNYLRLWQWNQNVNNWTELNYCDNCGDCGTNTILEQAKLSADTYYLEIGGIENYIDGLEDFGEYLIDCSCSDSAPGYPVISSISCDENNNTISGDSRATYDFYSDDEDEDGEDDGDQYSFSFYSFTINNNITKYSFKYDACATDAYLEIWKWNDAQWIIDKECKDVTSDSGSKPCGKCDNTTDEITWASLSNDAVAGKYYLGVLNQYGTGGYKITMHCEYVTSYQSTLERDRKLEKTVIYILIALMIILCIIALAGFFYNRRKDTPIDNGKYWSLIEYGLQVFDFVTDCNLAYELLSYVSNDYGGSGDANVYIFIAALGATTFTVIPYLINIYKALKIKKLVRDNIVAKLYFEQNTSLFVLMCMCSGGIYSTLKVLSSHLFGLRILNCGLTSYDLRKVLPLKIYSSVLLENTPQLVCQVMYANALGTITFNTAMSSGTSLLSIFSALISFYIKSQSLLNSEAVVYYIELHRKNDLNVQEKVNMLKFKDLKRKLRLSIAMTFGVSRSCFEVGFVTLTGNGCIIHLVQYVFRDDLKETMMRLDSKLSEKHGHRHRTTTNSIWQDMSSIKFVRTLYRVCEDKVVNTLCRHFDLRTNGFKINFHRSFPYKFEDSIMNNNDIEMVFDVEDNDNMNQLQRSIDTDDNYIPLRDEDDSNYS